MFQIHEFGFSFSLCVVLEIRVKGLWKVLEKFWKFSQGISCMNPVDYKLTAYHLQAPIRLIIFGWYPIRAMMCNSFMASLLSASVAFSVNDLEIY
jgi:hypothetical protein